MPYILKEHPLMDKLLQIGNLKNDAELARKLEVAPPVISKIRNGRMRIAATMILRAHEKFAMPVTEIRALLGEGARA